MSLQKLLSAPRIGALITLSAAFAWGCIQLWPVHYAPWWQYGLAGICGLLALNLAGRAIMQIAHYHHQDDLRSRSKYPPASDQGARFANEAEMTAKELFNPNNGRPIGQFNGRPIFYSFTHSLCLAPAGTGKTISLALPALAHGYRNTKHRLPSGCYSTLCVDLKSELLPMSWRLRKQKHGQRIIVLAPGMEGSDAYNPLSLIKDALEGRVSINKALTRAKGLALDLEPEPPSDAKNKFFRDGSRKIMTLTILYVCLQTPDQANLTEVRRLIMNSSALLDMLEQATILDALNGELALMAQDILAEDKHFFEFRSGASMALEPYSPAGELAPLVSHSTFRWHELKTIPTTVFICVNLHENKVFKGWLKINTECAMTEIAQEPGNIPVHILLDEATNFAFDISEKLTALRGVGVRVDFIAQEYEEILRVFGKHAGPTLFNECDLKQFFGISDPELAKKLSEIMGEKLVARQTYNLGKSAWEDINQSSQYERIPLMNVQEILDMKPDEQLVFIKGLKPIRCQKLRYDEVQPWLSWLDDNPLEGGKLPGPAHIRLDYTRRGVRVTACRKRTQPQSNRRSAPRKPLLPLWLTFTGVWIGAVYVAWQNLA